ncbi:MAG: hypothetical protein AAF960_08575 [Bacteroidota bacterium]
MLKYTLLLLMAGLFFTSCGGNSTEGKGLSKEEKWNTKPEAVKVSSLPSISFEEMKKIYEGADFIDIIFYNVDFSMSVNNKSNIQRMVGFVSTNVADINPDCKAMGRLFFQQNGELLVEADMYYDEQCRYFVFQKNGKAAYANQITPEGQAYFAKIFSQVKVEPVQ